MKCLFIYCVFVCVCDAIHPSSNPVNRQQMAHATHHSMHVSIVCLPCILESIVAQMLVIPDKYERWRPSDANNTNGCVVFALLYWKCCWTKMHSVRNFTFNCFLHIICIVWARRSLWAQTYMKWRHCTLCTRTRLQLQDLLVGFFRYFYCSVWLTNALLSAWIRDDKTYKLILYIISIYINTIWKSLVNYIYMNERNGSQTLNPLIVIVIYQMPREYNWRRSWQMYAPIVWYDRHIKICIVRWPVITPLAQGMPG